MRREAEQIFRKALAAVDVRSAVEREIRLEQEWLSVGEVRVRIAEIDRVVMLAVGKAAATMYTAAAAAIDRLAGRLPVEALVVGPLAPEPDGRQTPFFPGSHPVPNSGSRAAAATALSLLRSADSRTLVVFLISGGASSMLETPLDGEITVAETAALHEALVASGLSIGKMNVVRKHFSAVKGGRLAVAAGRAAAQSTLIVSDVPAGTLDAVGSGPSLPDSSTREQAIDLFEHLPRYEHLPPRLRRFYDSATLPETPKVVDPLFERCRWTGILSSDDLERAAAKEAQVLGFHVRIENASDEWEYRDAGQMLLRASADLGRQHGRSCLIAVGEVAVQLNGVLGRGGRNQQFALWCAGELERQAANTLVLSAGSDGIDGNSPAAGAMADADTWGRARRAGLNPEQALAAFDSFPLFERLGDAMITGSTGTNLRDLRLFLTP